MVEQVNLFEREPFFLQWHITNSCNLACVHCYNENNNPVFVDQHAAKHVIQQYISLLSHIGKSGRVQLAGGEPFLHPELCSIISLCRKQGMAIRVLSNGTLITPAIAQEICEAGCYIVQVSLEGRKKTDDLIRGKNSYDSAMEGIANLKKAALEVTLSVTLSKKNRKEISALFKIAAASADRLVFHRLVPIGTGTSLIDDMLTPKQLFRVYKIILRLRKRYPRLDVPLRDPLWRSLFRCGTSQILSGCSAGFNGLSIEANGDVYPCRRLPIVIGNVFRETLVSIWDKSPVLHALRNRSQRGNECDKCNSVWSCGGCPAIAYGTTGDYMQKDVQCFVHL